ncbi:MAG: tail fiber protein [Pedobacter sp.]|nr:MAG: tail fiber protein [Pedobacter sp.]
MDFYLGGIILFAGNFAPQGWAFCDGSLLSVNENMALFSVLGTTYGGDGVTNFALPNLPDQAGTKHIIALVGIYPSRA